ncbi:phosphosugar-binding transcriptional regulator [Klebsiella pneumoniae]|uniref:Phosphosugar-binding transcriptional regulator n=1 Tax=Klebsiella pneumoniae TaxID=573 RepID=A0A3S5DHD4_KLEPN|nr:phosphosugar-binding transcriptional regulator [Klebsiella pneumoniae]
MAHASSPTSVNSATILTTPYFPVTNDMARNALAIVLSVSGETEEILRFASQFSLPSLQGDVDYQP